MVLTAEEERTIEAEQERVVRGWIAILRDPNQPRSPSNLAVSETFVGLSTAISAATIARHSRMLTRLTVALIAISAVLGVLTVVLIWATIVYGGA